MSIIKIAVLAVIQGGAELLPVSSSAHVIVAEKLMGLDPSIPEMTFLLVMLHTGTMFAVLIFFWSRWKTILGDRIRRLEFIRAAVIATAITGLIGLGLKIVIEKIIFERLLGHAHGEVENLFGNLPLIGGALLAVGIIIIRAGTHESKAVSTNLTNRQSILIGAIQGLCLPFRGFSRSGATISMGLLAKVARPLAEDFSFALAVLLTPPVILLELRRLMKATAPFSIGISHLVLPGLIGMVLSFAAGLAALRFLSAVLEKGRWKYFGFYCVAASIAVFAMSIAGM